MAEVQWQLRQGAGGLSKVQAEFLANKAKHYGEPIEVIQKEQSEFKLIVRAAGAESWARVFYHCAKELLDSDIFNSLDIQTRELLENRKMFEIEKAQLELTGAARINRITKERRQKRRKTWRASSQKKTG
jgi:hypothetical protein